MSFNDLSPDEKAIFPQKKESSDAEITPSGHELTPEQKKELDTRIRQLGSNPSSALDWQTIKRRVCGY